jgi:hypothetical protein
MQKARGNHCIKKISQVSVVHENCCKPILTIEKKRASANKMEMRGHVFKRTSWTRVTSVSTGLKPLEIVHNGEFG